MGDNMQRLEIVKYLGGKCRRCGYGPVREDGSENPFFDPWVLHIDHVLNDGAQERALLKESGEEMYSFIAKHADSKRYQLLCANCNFSKKHWGWLEGEKKECKGCFKILDVEMFRHDISRKDNRDVYCKDCRKTKYTDVQEQVIGDGRYEN